MDMTITAGERENIPTAICGEMAGDITLLPLLIGLGATSMSVGVHLVPIIRYAIRNLDYGQCRDMAQKALQAPNSRAIVPREYESLTETSVSCVIISTGHF